MIFELLGENLSIRFDYKNVFNNINIKLNNAEIIGIIGPNGSGKTTLLKILCNLIRPTNGKLTLKINETSILKDEFNNYIGLVAPYINFYEEFTPLEIIRLTSQLRSVKFNENKAIDMLKRFDLHNRRNDSIKTFSSGMKQRLRFILNFYHKPIIMLFDEPYTNLDEVAIKTIEELTLESISNSCGIIIASNNKEEIKMCSKIIELEKK